MATNDQEFVSRLRATFKIEAEEHLQAISSRLLELEKSPAPESPTDAIEFVFREAHSLKGAARAVDMSEIEAVCQAMEGVFAAWKREQSGPSPDALDALHQALDMMHELTDFANGGQEGNQVQARSQLIERLGNLQLHTAAPSPDPQRVVEAKPTLKPAPAMPVAPPETEKNAAVQTVRIPIEKLDSRLLQAEDMLTVKSLTAQRAVELRELTGDFSRWQRQWAKVSVNARSLRQGLEHKQNNAVSASNASTGTILDFLEWNFDYVRAMENKISSLAVQAQQDRHVVGKRVDELLEDSKKLLMLPFSSVANLFPKLIRDLCRDQCKDAEITIRGGDVEIDKRILEQMKDALIHILRNCVDHGIETPAERERFHKPVRATITVAVAAIDGNKVEIMVSDDGAGVDLARVKDSAVRHGILSEAEARVTSDAQALNLIFHSEVSASPSVTAISGRGLGMAIVQAQTKKLGGRVSIESKHQVGTSIRMVLPLTLATFRGVLAVVADRVFVIPTVNVDRVMRIKPSDIQSVANRQSILLDGKAISLARLDAVLELPVKSEVGDHSSHLPVIVLYSGDRRIAFIVDGVLREEEVLVKPLRKPLVRVRNIAGATVLGTGKTVPVLNVADLIHSARNHGSAPETIVSAEKTSVAPAKRILIAEDSITSRMLLKGILEGAGYSVRTAVDGLDAFTVLREDEFDLVVSDVEMPRMNGFDLTGRIRADKRLAELPVILVSALESREERERGIDAGASAYLVKSSFDQSDLLEAVGRMA